MGKKNQRLVQSYSKAASRPANKSEGNNVFASSFNAISELVEESNQLLQTLEPNTTNKNATRLWKIEESTKILHHLLDNYKSISIKNKIDSKREELLQQEINELQRRNQETKEEIRQLKEEHHAKEVKLETLENLSKQLTSRLRTSEVKTNEEIKEEKEHRLQLSYDFSSTIKEISQKLDALGKKREAVINENSRLKSLLKSCLEKFDQEQQLEKQKQEKLLENQPQENSVHEETANEGDEKSKEIDSDNNVSSEDSKMSKEQKEMAMEDDLSRIYLLKSKEDILKQHTLKFVEIFDSFQQRLTKSNHLFQIKQQSVEEMTKEIKKLENQNNTLSSRIIECSTSLKNFHQSNLTLMTEREKYLKMMEKQRALIEKFQSDIIALESHNEAEGK